MVNTAHSASEWENISIFPRATRRVYSTFHRSMALIVSLLSTLSVLCCLFRRNAITFHLNGKCSFPTSKWQTKKKNETKGKKIVWNQMNQRNDNCRVATGEYSTHPQTECSWHMNILDVKAVNCNRNNCLIIHHSPPLHSRFGATIFVVYWNILMNANLECSRCVVVVIVYCVIMSTDVERQLFHFVVCQTKRTMFSLLFSLLLLFLSLNGSTSSRKSFGRFNSHPFVV